MSDWIVNYEVEGQTGSETLIHRQIKNRAACEEYTKRLQSSYPQSLVWVKFIDPKGNEETVYPETKEN